MLYLAVASAPNCFLRQSMSSAVFVLFFHLLLGSWWCVFYEMLQQLHVSPALQLFRHLRHRFNSDIPGSTGTALINVWGTVEMSHWHLAVISGLAESPIHVVVEGEEQMESMQAISRSFTGQINAMLQRARVTEYAVSLFSGFKLWLKLNTTHERA